MRRRLVRTAVGFTGIALALQLVVSGVGCALSAPTWKGQVSPHFDGTKFVTPGAPAKKGGFDLAGFGALVSWQVNRKPGPWKDFREEKPGPPPPYEAANGQMRVTFINHATTLIQMDGVNILTDPIYVARASPFQFIGPHRVRPPGIRFEDLPRIDVVVISHNHYDHLDIKTLEKIGATWPHVQVFAGLGNKAFLEQHGLLNVSEFDWWETRAVKSITVHSVPNQHFSNRGLFDSDGTLWSAWVFEGSAGKAYFGGDTAYGPHFTEAREKLGPMRLAVLPIGAYLPEWFMGPIHMSPSEAVQAAIDLQAVTAVPMHYGTFPLADDGETEALEALQKTLKEKPAPFVVLDFGEGRDVPEATP